jgi:hypothetical protein
MKKFTLFSIACLLGNALSFSKAQADSYDQRLAQLEQQMKEVGVKNAHGSMGALFASDPKTERGWYVDIEPLLWRTRAGGTDWVLIFNQADYPLEGTMRSLSFKWNWGVRVGMTKNIGAENWDINAFYTTFTNSSDQKVIDAYSSLDELTGTIAKGKTTGSFKGRINLNQVDLNIGKSFFVSKHLHYHPYAGLMAAWVKQRYNLLTNNEIDALQTSIPVAGTLNQNLVDQCKVFGIGPKVGLDTKWYLCNGFKINAALAGALLQSYYEVTRQEHVNLHVIGDEPVDFENMLDAPFHRLMPYAKLVLGLGYEKFFMEGKRKLDLSLNWEINQFWRVNQTVNNISNYPADISFGEGSAVRMKYYRYSEDITFYGINFRVNVGF